MRAARPENSRFTYGSGVESALSGGVVRIGAYLYQPIGEWPQGGKHQHGGRSRAELQDVDFGVSEGRLGF